jgi:hypothetical protein
MSWLSPPVKQNSTIAFHAWYARHNIPIRFLSREESPTPGVEFKSEASIFEE